MSKPLTVTNVSIKICLSNRTWVELSQYAPMTTCGNPEDWIDFDKIWEALEKNRLSYRGGNTLNIQTYTEIDTKLEEERNKRYANEY